MDIDVIYLKNYVNKLSSLIDEYELNYLEFYNVVNKETIFWDSKKGLDFFSDVDLEKRDIGLFIGNIKDVLSLYNYLIDKYGYIGNKVSVKISNKDKLLACFDSFLNEVYSLIDMLHELDYESIPDISSTVYSYLDFLIDVGNMAVNLKTSLKNHFDLCETFEREVRFKISKIDVKLIKEIDINRFL